MIQFSVTGASTNPSSNTYAGLGPFSEPETRSLSEFINSIGNRIELYLSFHSAGQLLLIPYGNTTEPLANYYDAVSVKKIYQLYRNKSLNADYII